MDPFCSKSNIAAERTLIQFGERKQSTVRSIVARFAGRFHAANRFEPRIEPTTPSRLRSQFG